MTMSDEQQYDVRIIKLSSGADVVAKVIGETDEMSILVQNPMYLGVQQDPASGRVGLAMQPFSFGGKLDRVEINNLHVVSLMEAEDQVAQNYLAALAGIIPADASALSDQPARVARGRLTLVD